MRKPRFETNLKAYYWHRVATYLPALTVFLLGCYGQHIVAYATGVAASIPTASLPATPAIAVLPQDGFNLQLVEVLPGNHLSVKLATPVHNWFAGTFTHLSTDTPMSIGFSMEGNVTERNTADVSKWQGLVPVMTYADPTQYASYEWFHKDDQGRWMSSDLFKLGDAKFAGTDTVPEQQVIPAELAAQFLSTDGMTWNPWRDVDVAEAKPNLNIFRVTQTFARDTATVAMRVPYTYTYEQAFLKKLKDAQLPGVFVDEIGFTPTGRKLYIIRIEQLSMQEETTHETERPTILVYAREHATEHDGSWVIEGMLRWLLSDEPLAIEARQKSNWLFIPILDVEGSCNSVFRVGDFFQVTKPIMREAVAYALYLVRWLDTGHRLDIVMNLHNVECTEDRNFFCPLINSDRITSVRKFNQNLFNRLKADGFSVGNPYGDNVGIQIARLSGWCNSRFSTYDLMYEVNTCDPSSRLTMNRTARLGALVAQELYRLEQSKDFSAIEEEITDNLAKRQVLMQTYWRQVGHDASGRKPYELFLYGY